MISSQSCRRACEGKEGSVDFSLREKEIWVTALAWISPEDARDNEFDNIDRTPSPLSPSSSHCPTRVTHQRSTLLQRAHRKHSHDPKPMDSLIPFTTSGSLVDCVDSTSARAPAPRAQSCASFPHPLFFFFFILPQERCSSS